MIVLSIDQSSTSSGYCICYIDYDFKTLKIIEHGCIKATGTFEERLKTMCEKIELLLKEHKIDLIILEGVFKLANIKTFGELSQLLGALKELAFLYKIQTRIIVSSEWRRLLNVPPKTKRAELKRLSKKYVFENFNLNISDDIADSICIAYYWYLKEKGEVL